MSAANRQSILIIEPSEQLREEIFNFLLSAGYEDIAAADSLPAALGKINQSEYDVMIADTGNPLTAGLQFAEDIARISPNTRIIFIINVEDQRLWDRIAPQSDNVQFLIKTDFARNLLYLLEENTQP
jgi:DNA-binding NarL/FixJ family response regulator